MTSSAKQRRVGIIGDGQLALMLAESLQKFGAEFLALTMTTNSPMQRIFPERTTGDKEKFQKDCSVFTLENEFLTVDALTLLLKEKSSTLFPDLKSYSFFANKISQRRLYQELNLPSPKWLALESAADLEKLKVSFPYPFMLKASAGGYDGKGLRIIADEASLEQALKDFGFHEGNQLLIEELLSIKQELAQGFVQNSLLEHTLLPLVETVQVDGVCNLVTYPASTSEDIAAEISSMIQKLIKHPLVGIFNFEFIVDASHKVYINEGAPRPHNSQHLTIDASTYSQFDLLALYLIEKSNIPREVSTKPSAMVNILGKSSGHDYKLTLPDLDPKLRVVPKLYGKETSSPGRKMGHVNIVDVSGTLDLVEIGQKILREYDL